MSERSRAQRWTYDATRVLARLVGVVLFRIRCQGREHFPRSGGALICANHQSFFDPVLVGLSCDRHVNYLARESLFHFCPFGWLIRWYDAIPIQREGMGIGGLKESLRRLKRGEMVLIFPEGTRTPNGQVQELQPGFCALARRAKVPLVPVGIDGAFDAWPRGQPLPGLSVIRLQIGQPLEFEESEELQDRQLIDELRQRMVACHAAARQSRIPLNRVEHDGERCLDL